MVVCSDPRSTVLGSIFTSAPPAARTISLMIRFSFASFSLPHLPARDRTSNFRCDALKCGADSLQRGRPVFDRQVNQIDVHGQPREIAHEEIDRGATLEREARFSIHKGHHLHEQVSLFENGLSFMAPRMVFRLRRER